MAAIVISRRSPLLSAKGFSTGKNAAGRWIRPLLKGELVIVTPGASSAGRVCAQRGSDLAIDSAIAPVQKTAHQADRQHSQRLRR